MVNEYFTTLDGMRLYMWYNSKTHKYHITADEIENEFIVSKAKGEAIKNFLVWFANESLS